MQLYGKNSNHIDSLTQTVWSYSEDIGMKFVINKCAVLELESGRVVRSEGIESPDEERMEDVYQEGYKYLGVLQLDKAMNKDMKENIGNEYIRRVKSENQIYLNAGNLWHECLGYSCDEVQWRNYRLDKRGTSGY